MVNGTGRASPTAQTWDFDGMTVRSVIIGLLVAAALASFGYINDVWMFFSYIGGDLLPTFAFGLLLIGLLLVNPLLRLFGVWKFRSSEWVVILSMAFMGSVFVGVVAHRVRKRREEKGT